MKDHWNAVPFNIEFCSDTSIMLLGLLWQKPFFVWWMIMYVSPLYNTLNCFHWSSLILDTLYVTSCLHAWHKLIDNCENMGCQQFDTKMDGILLWFAVIELFMQDDARCLDVLKNACVISQYCLWLQWKLVLYNRFFWEHG